MSNELVVRCCVRVRDEETHFSDYTATMYDLEKAKPVEVTTEHEKGPLKDLLRQLESVQLQSNHHLTQLIQKLKPTSSEDEPDAKRQKTQ